MFLTVLLPLLEARDGSGRHDGLSGVSVHAKELLRITSLDMIWPMYATRQEALEALLSD